MPFCTNCGKEVFETDSFCANCGEKIARPKEEKIITARAHENIPPVASDAPRKVTFVQEQPQAEAPAPVAPAEDTVAPGEPTYTVPAPENVPASAPAFEYGYAHAPREDAAPKAAAKKKFNVCALIGLILSGIALVYCWLSLIDLLFIIPAAILVIIGLVTCKRGGKCLAIAGAVVLAVAVTLAGIFTYFYYKLAMSGELDFYYDFDNGITPYEDKFGYDEFYGDDIHDETELEYAYSAYCDSSFAIISDDGDHLSLDTNPEDYNDYVDYDALSAIEDINYYLCLPDTLIDDIKATKSIDGKQTRVYDEYTVSWTYHPASGIEVLYTDN